MRRSFLFPTCLLLAAACGGDDLVLPSEGSPAAIAVVQGDGQSGRVGETLADPIVVLVTDTRDRPVVGVAVAFAFNGGTVAPDTVVTDENGRASVELRLGSGVGDAQGTARVTTAGSLQATFTATAVPASAQGMAEVSGDNQSGVVGATLRDPLVVKVTDAFGNPNKGVTITWTVVGGGSVSASTTVTDASGRTSVTRALGPAAGTQTTRASASGLAGSPVVFTHIATSAAASSVVIVSGDNQTASVATQLPQDLVVQVRDALGNAVAGAQVTWVVTAGGGGVSPSSGATDGNGRTSTRWTLGSAPGTNHVEARVSGAGAAAFTATAATGASASLMIQTQPSSSAAVGVPFDRQPVVQLRDASGNNVARSGVAVTAAIASGDGTLVGTATRNTDDNGRATFTNLRITSATGAHTLIFAASGHTSVTSDAINVQQAATTTVITSHDPDPSAPNQTVTVAFSVTSAGGAPSGTVTVTASGGGESCVANVSEGHCALVLTTAGTRTLTASYGGDALFTASAGTVSHTVVTANSPPAFQIQGDQSAPANGGAQAVANFAQVTSLGGLGEGGQTAHFLVDVDPAAAGLFSVVPTISPDGTLTYTPAGTAGTASITVRLMDDGGTANGGRDTSDPQTFTITLTLP